MTSSEIWNQPAEIAHAAKQFDTPFYCYDAAAIQKTFNSLRKALPKNVDIFYSIKANPNIALCNELKQLGACAELCSYYEIIAALKAGFDPYNIIFVGPAKSDKEIKKCLALGVYAIICESIEEYKRVSILAGACGVIARVGIRINPSHVAKSALLKMGGQPSQFGMDEEIVFANPSLFSNTPHVKLIGIHIYNGTRILNPDTIVDNTTYILNLARRLQHEWNQTFEMIDIGGGLGVPYFDNETPLDITALKSLLTPVIENYISQFPNTRIILESGRYLMATAGVLISRVLDIKSSKGQTFVITDGGTNCHMAAVGVGSLVKRNFPIDAVLHEKNNDATLFPYNITGPLCTPGDLIGKQVRLPKLSIGDLVMVKHAGAYGPTASPVMFLSHGFPAEVLFKQNKFHLIRSRFTERELIDTQYLVN